MARLPRSPGCVGGANSMGRPARSRRRRRHAQPAWHAGSCGVPQA
ncbi:hypothetical protein C7S16_1355 [Burkholderia thailandensis]|uniref:Uncharacterized protein n=1 Tax=Burkholderia thailandensis TaxID=57975 RepID=A0AAW9D563_BURTH|nr:hypothetical protein [Burkholderia thailandensis]MDW9257184.1 hypothetical protein [Burkholderia thailandensis]